jgi:hypothetical protein
MVERIDIERALDDLKSNEAGMSFQALGVVLAKLRWPELIACERHNDLGLDAYASPTVSRDGIGKGLACSTTAKLTKLKGDGKTATEHYGPLSLLIFATPEKVTKETEDLWSDAIRSSYGLELVVLSREDIITTLQLPDNAAICRSHLKISIAYQPPVAELLGQVREAAAEVIADWAVRTRGVGQPQLMLNAIALDESGNETAETFAVSDVRALLLRGFRIVLEAPAGRGKTTTLVQLADANGQAAGVPLLIDLPAWVRSERDILDYAAQQPAFRSRGISAESLARLARTEPYLFLLNGWNEIAEIRSSDAVVVLAEVERTFPTAGIIIATRTHHVRPPLPGARRIRLLPLTAGQRFQYLREALEPEQAQSLHATLSNDRVLDEITRTPFVLAEVTKLFRSGREIPRTKLSLLAAVVTLNEQLEQHRAALQMQPLGGRAADYLRALATTLTARGDVLLAEAEARTICSGVSEELRRAGQIAAPPEPNLILAALASHHVLERIDYPEVSFRFEHQQFQEYFAAVALRENLWRVALSADPLLRATYARSYLNEPTWDEVVEMIADDLSGSERDVAAGRVLVQTALPLDPVFAARLARLSGASVWTEVRDDLHRRLRTLYASSNGDQQQCAVAAMLATGGAEFADVIVPLLTSPDQQVRHATYRAGPEFYPSSIGAGWQTVVASWPEGQRIEFMSQLTIGYERVEVASTFARTDPSEAVRIEAVRLLAWMRQRDEVAGLLATLSDAECWRAIERTNLDDLSPRLRARALLLYEERLAESNDPKVRVSLSLTLAEHVGGDATQLKRELTNLSGDVVTELSNYSLRRAVDTVRRSDPAWVSEFVAHWIVEGALWPDSWLLLVSRIRDSLRDDLFQRTAAEEIQRGGAVAVLAATADCVLAKRAFEALRDQRRSRRADPTNEREHAIERQLESLVRGIPVPVLFDGLAAMLAADPHDEDVDVVISIFGESRREAAPALPDASREQLRRYLKSAVAAVCAREDFRGEAKAYLATALADVGSADDMPDLVALLRADIDRVRTGRELRLRGERSARSEGATMSYSFWHVQAIVRIEPVQAEPILCELLAEPEYECDAAWALRELARKEPSARRTIEGRFFGASAPDYRKVLYTSEWSRLFDVGRRVKYAAAIRERIGSLLDESRATPDSARANHWRVKELVKALAALDPHDSADLILEVAGLPLGLDGWTPVALVEALVFGGVTLPAERAIALIEPVVERLRTHGTYNDNTGLVRRLSCVLPFVDPPARGVARVHDLLTEFRLASHEQRELLIALGQCRDDDALTLLCELARQGGEHFRYIAREWLEAVAGSPLPRARQVLLGLVDLDVPNVNLDLALFDDALDGVAARVAQIAQSDDGIASRILELAAGAVLAERRVVLAKVCARMSSTRSLIAGLSLIDDDADPPIPYDVSEALEEVFLEKRPSVQMANAHSLVPRAASDVRTALYNMSIHDPRRGRSATRLLLRIEAWRLEHGRPASEPRHPALESGTLWPPPTNGDTGATA